MSSISAGTTSTTGYVVTSDTTGALVLKTGASATTALTIDTSQNVSLAVGSANGVTYLNGSKVLTSGSALTFDGTNFVVNNGYLRANNTLGYYTTLTATGLTNSATTMDFDSVSSYLFKIASSEQMRLTSTGLGIGTSSPANPTGGKGFEISNASGASIRATSSTTYLDLQSGGSANYILSNGAYPLLFYTNGSERMRLDSAGNLGLGVTPSAWGSPFSAVMQFTKGAIACQSNSIQLMNNAYYDGTNYKYVATAGAGFYEQTGGIHLWKYAASGTAGNTVTFTEGMRLDASGRLGIGTTSPASALHVSGDTSLAGLLYLGASTVFQEQRLSVIGTTSGSTGLAFSQWTGAAYTERARIDSSGRFAIAVAGNAYSQDAGLTVNGTGFTRAIYTNINGTASSTHCSFANGNGVVGSITTSGSTTTYSTSSDYRLKNTIAPMTGALAKVAQLKPCTYKWNADGSDGEGFIAHELAEVVPQCVTGEKDAVDENGNPKYQGIDTSFLVATLTAAIQEQQAMIQEQQAIIQQLQADVAALKGTP